jgi:hypothetical protein
LSLVTAQLLASPKKLSFWPAQNSPTVYLVVVVLLLLLLLLLRGSCCCCSAAGLPKIHLQCT